MDNVFLAYYEFRKGKRNNKDVLEFEVNLEENLFLLYHDLVTNKYQHSGYSRFLISDPKPRIINKPRICDRIVHHLVAKKLEEMFEPIFIFDVYSSRIEKGTFKAIERVCVWLKSVRKKEYKEYLILKCDIKKFFASVDHKVLKNILVNKIKDEKFLDLLVKIIDSFEEGIPLGNVTSQVLANIYLNELDQFVKHRLKIKKYARYCDDLIFIVDKYKSNEVVDLIDEFLWEKLKLQLHSNKIVMRKINQGVDWLGFVLLPKYMRIRTKTKNRIFRRCEKRRNNYLAGARSYFGLLSHGSNFKVRRELCRILCRW